MTSVKRDGKTYRCFYPASNGSSSLQILECEGEVEVWDGAPADLDDDRVATAGKEHGAIFECQLTNYLRGNMIGKFTAARVWVGQGFPGEKYVTIGNTLLLEGVNLEDDEEKTPSLVFISGKSILAIKPRGAIEEYHSDNASNDFPYAVRSRASTSSRSPRTDSRSPWRNAPPEKRSNRFTTRFGAAEGSRRRKRTRAASGMRKTTVNCIDTQKRLIDRINLFFARVFLIYGCLCVPSHALGYARTHKNTHAHTRTPRWPSRLPRMSHRP